MLCDFCFNSVSVRVCVFSQQRNLEGYVGFANLPNQVYRKSVKRGFEFTLMVVGKLEKFTTDLNVEDMIECLLLFLCQNLCAHLPAYLLLSVFCLLCGCGSLGQVKDR